MLQVSSYNFTYCRPNDCTVKDSKMRPLWLVWTNIDQNADDIYIMYKNGDGKWWNFPLGVVGIFPSFITCPNGSVHYLSVEQGGRWITLELWT